MGENLHLAVDLNKLGTIDFAEWIISGRFVTAKKGAMELEKINVEGSKIMAIADYNGFPFALFTNEASTH